MCSLKAGIVGLGSISQRFILPNLSKWNDVDIEAICDVEDYKVRINSSRYGVKNCFSKVDEMLEKVKLDVVFIAVPPQYTFDVARKVLEKGIPLYMEKPPGITYEESIKLKEIALSSNTPCMVAFNRRFMPLVKEIKKLLQGLPPICQVSMEFNKYEPINFIKMFNTTPLTATVIHGLDLLRYIAGDIDDVRSLQRSDDSHFPNGFLGLLKFKSGAYGTINCHWLAGGRVERYSFHGHGYSFYLSPPDECLLYTDDVCQRIEVADETIGGLLPNELNGFSMGFAGELRHFLDAIKSSRPIGPDINSAVETMGFVDLMSKNNW